MRVDCQRCAQAHELESLGVVEGGFGFSCEGCQHLNLLAPIQGSGPPASEGPVSCPKCAHRQSNEESCDRCGLRFSQEAPQRSSEELLGEHPMREALIERWGSLREALDDEEGHSAFIALCAQERLLEFAGHCYRREEGEGPRRVAYRQRVLQLAMSHVGRFEREGIEESKRFKRMFLMSLIALFILGMAVMYRLMITGGRFF